MPGRINAQIAVSHQEMGSSGNPASIDSPFDQEDGGVNIGRISRFDGNFDILILQGNVRYHASQDMTALQRDADISFHGEGENKPGRAAGAIYLVRGR